MDFPDSEIVFKYKETRLNLDPIASSSVVRIEISSPGANRRKSSRPNGAESVAADEKTYRTQKLATASSVFHRPYHRWPRSFLWRVLEGGTVLSIRVADSCRPKKAADAHLILNLEFPHAIRVPCIDFADHRDHDVLCVFLVDQANQLWSLTLRPDMFRKTSIFEDGLAPDFCKTYLPPSFALKHPHRLLAVDAEQLIVTMHDGGMLRFDKNRAHDATSTSLWKENVYNAASWGQSLRGLVPMYRNPTIKYDKINMEMSAAASAVVANMGEKLEPYLFTVCLDHRMRIWEAGSGQIVYAGDILDVGRDPQEVGTRLVVDPSQNNLIRIIEVSQRCIVITYSPVGEEFKFWQVKVNAQGSVMVEDWSPKGSLKSKSPTADVWSLADFAATDRGQWIELWVLWKNNITWRSQTICVYPNNAAQSLEGWKSVFVGNTTPWLEASGPCDAEDATEKWLDTILYPGRFSKSTIETALAMYEKGLGTRETAPRGPGTSLAESICSVIGSTASLDRTANGMDYDQFRATSETQWLRLWRLLLEMDKLGGEALSFVLDVRSGMICVVCAGCVSVIRNCSGMERLYCNLPSLQKNSLASLVSAGLTFFEVFTDSMRQLCRATLQQELFEDLPEPELDRIQSFVDQSGFWRQVSDEDCATVVDTLGQDFRVVTRKLYTDLFELMTMSEGDDPELPLTDLGRKMVVRTVQETAELHHQVLFSQFILLTHMELEIENEEDALHSRFDVAGVYRHLLSALRRLEPIRWMTRTEMSLPMPKKARSRSASGSGSMSASFSSAVSGGSLPTEAKPGLDELRIITPLEGVLDHLWGMPDHRDQDLYRNLTELAVNLCALNSETELVPYLQQCWFLKLDRPDLALELSPFSDQEPFATYVQGRVFLALKDFDTAALYFKKASVGLSISKLPGRHSVGLLDNSEWDLLEDGFAAYYSHIVNLFDRKKAYSFVIEFAQLGLQFAQANVASEAPLRTELLGRLFLASTALSHFAIAHSALLETEDAALQASCLKKLIERMCLTGQNTELINLPFSGLVSQVDKILEGKCHMSKDVVHDIPYHQILYAWRVKHHDYRGAAAILMDRLHKLRALGEGDRLGSDDVMDTPVTRQYLQIINALTCVPKEEAWILEDILPGEDEYEYGDKFRSDDMERGRTLDDLRATVDKLVAEAGDPGHDKDEDEDEDWQAALSWYSNLAQKRCPPRRLLTLPDIRRQYQRELDRVVAIRTNQFEFAGEDDDAMDIA